MTNVVPGATRNTRQRAEVLALLDATEGFRSAQQLHVALRDHGVRVGLTTVYRTLQLLSDAGEVDQMRTPEGEQLYRRCGRSGHHHHMVCRSCGHTVELAAASVERWAREQAARHGFVDTDHTVEIVGVCADCARERPATVDNRFH